MLAGSATECAENGPTGPVGGHQVPWSGVVWDVLDPDRDRRRRWGLGEVMANVNQWLRDIF